MSDYSVAVHMMDDDLREEIHAAMAPCADSDFLDAYIEAHATKFSEAFVW